MKKIIKNLMLSFVIIIIFITVAGIYKFNYLANKEGHDVDGNKIKLISFFECMEAGNAVMESYPRQCRDGVGNLFIEDIGNELEKVDLIRSDNPRPNQIITSPLTISGEARGFWFFEGDFPVVLVDEDGEIIVESYLSTSEDWMTEDFVGFTNNLEFSLLEHQKKGKLILKKDNPSGLAENDDFLEIPILFE